MSLDLDADQIRGLLAELDRRLRDAGVAATVYVVGGAAVALQLPRTDRRTRPCWAVVVGIIRAGGRAPEVVPGPRDPHLTTGDPQRTPRSHRGHRDGGPPVTGGCVPEPGIGGDELHGPGGQGLGFESPRQLGAVGLKTPVA
jgi:hypothetical protein